MQFHAQMGHPHCHNAVIWASLLEMLWWEKETGQGFAPTSVQELIQELNSPKIRLVISNDCFFFLKNGTKYKLI